MATFPTQLDSRSTLLKLLGGFWSDTYQGQDLLAELLHARGQLVKQTFRRLQEAIDCRNRFDIPVYKYENWVPLLIDEATVASFPNLYGEETYYDDGSVYGQRSGSLAFTYPIDESIADCLLITNRVTNPSVSLVSGLDFVIDRNLHVIRFNKNPMEMENLQTASTDTVTNGVLLWMSRPSIDDEYLYNHFGYVVKMWARSSQNYKTLLNSVYDSIVLGTSIGRTIDAIAAVTGIPVAKGDETVSELYEDDKYKLVLTDKNAYRISKYANVIVSEGDELVTDQTLSDGMEIHELNRGIAPSSISGLSLHKGLLPGNYIDEIGFPNRTESTAITHDVNDVIDVTFPLGGHPFDVEAFWEEVHNRGIASGQTLANLLDSRTNKEGDPVESNLPSTINPFEFLVQNVLRNSAFIVKIRAQAILDDGVGVDKLSYINRLIHPHTAMLLLIDMPSLSEDAIIDYEETISNYVSAETVTEDVDQADVTEAIRNRRVSGHCV